MSGAYRDSANPTLGCPRCGETLPSDEVACCIAGCGVWIPAALAETALEPVERAANRVTNWWRPLVACPHCNEAMTRRGHDMVPFQGCDEHGFWIDEENVSQTGLARRAFAPLLETARKHARALADERKRERMIELERLQQEEARRIAVEREQRDAVAAVRRIELEDRAARERACQPYLDLVRGAMRGGDPLPLAERLMRLEQLVEALRR